MRFVENCIYVEEVGDREYPKGWYFSDEVSDLVGAFGTIEEAEEVSRGR